MPADLVHHTGNWVTEHPYASAGIAVGALVILYLMFSGSSTPAPAVSTDNTGAAASVVAAQIAANSASALAQISANATDNQTAAAQTVALAQIQGSVDSAVATAAASSQVAQYNASAEIANSNASVLNTFTNAGAAEQLSNNATLQSEYSSLAGVLNNFFGNSPVFSNVTSNSAGIPATASGPQPISPASYLYAALGGPFIPIPYGSPTPGTAAVPATSTPVTNPNLVPATQSFLSGFGSLLAGMGKGLQAPVAPNLSETGILSALQINASAVNGWAAHA